MFSSSSISTSPFIRCVLVCSDLFHNAKLDRVVDRLLCQGTFFSISSSSSLLVMERFILCVLVSSDVFHNVMLDRNEDPNDFCCFLVDACLLCQGILVSLFDTSTLLASLLEVTPSSSMLLLLIPSSSSSSSVLFAEGEDTFKSACRTLTDDDLLPLFHPKRMTGDFPTAIVRFVGGTCTECSEDAMDDNCRADRRLRAKFRFIRGTRPECSEDAMDDTSSSSRTHTLDMRLMIQHPVSLLSLLSQRLAESPCVAVVVG
mmetsp:Transcript_4642/g.8251  ORF Transcript_4642/g.8251 Transcript_4642/m.8251 type:complete len:259 (-) Transcript_4642:734-1510(-)